MAKFKYPTHQIIFLVRRIDMKATKIMFDNMVIDNLKANWDIIISTNKNVEYHVTHVLMEEIKKIPDSKADLRIDNLNRITELVSDEEKSTIWVMGKQTFGSRLASKESSDIYNSIGNNNPKHTNDALIAEAAIEHNCTLVTNEKRLYNYMKRNSYDVMKFDEFLTFLKSS